MDGDAQRAILGDDLLEEVGGRVLTFVSADRRVAEARVIIDADVQKLPTGPAHVVAPIAGDAMAHRLDAAELLGVEVEQFSRLFAFVAHHRWWRRPGPVSAQDPAERRLGQANPLADLGVGQSFFTRPPDLLALGCGDTFWAVLRTR